MTRKNSSENIEFEDSMFTKHGHGVSFELFTMYDLTTLSSLADP